MTIGRHKYNSMNDTYFLSFLAGTSGRFISTIIWELANNLEKEILYSMYNSAHVETFCVDSWVFNQPDPTGNHDCYKLIEFDRSKAKDNPNQIALFISHIYPDFDTIFARFSESKLVLILADESDYMEIGGNYLFKNAIEQSAFNITPHRIWKIYKSLYGKDCTTETKFTEKEIYEMLQIYSENMHLMFEGSKFIEQTIPEQYLDKTLIISYRDIYKKNNEGTYIVYEQLKTLTNSIGNDIIEKNYEKYVLGRNKFLDTYLPWIKK